MPASSARSCSRFSRRSSGALRQRDETRQRGAAEGIDADMVPARPVAPGDRQRGRNTAPAQPRGRGRTRRRPSRPTACSPPHPTRSARPAWRCRMPDRPAAPARRAVARAGWSAGRPAGSPPRRAGRADPARRARHARGRSRAAASDRSCTARPPPAAPRRRSPHRRRPPRRDRYRPPRPRSQHVHDHRLAVDIGERLARQAGGRHAGRDDDDRVHGAWTA